MKILNLEETLELADGIISDVTIAEMKKVDAVYPVKISEYYARLAIKNESAFKQSFPTLSELDSIKYSEPDPLSEQSHQVVRGLIHKYRNKAIILTTNKCFMNCRHCTRKRLMHAGKDMAHPDYPAIFAYLENHIEINDVLLTGGDVLTLNDNLLLDILQQLKQISHINTIRLGTRAPVTFPQRIHNNLFSKIGEMGNVWVNTQFNHPCEITDQSITACKIIQKNGIPVCNQTVVLKGINDSYGVLKELFLGLVHYRIIPYYLYQCDNVEGVSHFIANPKIGAEAVKKLRLELPGIAVPRYIIDSQFGKIVAEYGNLISLSDNCAEMINEYGNSFLMKYETNFPKNV